MDLKKKFETAKTKVKAHAPEILGFASALFVGGVIIYLNRQTPRNYGPDDLTAYNLEDNGVDSGGYKLTEDLIHRQTITPEEMSRLLDDGTISAYSVEGREVTFYNLNPNTD